MNPQPVWGRTSVRPPFKKLPSRFRVSASERRGNSVHTTLELLLSTRNECGPKARLMLHLAAGRGETVRKPGVKKGAQDADSQCTLRLKVGGKGTVDGKMVLRRGGVAEAHADAHPADPRTDTRLTARSATRNHP